ncbi:MAG: hypothetical protein LBH59_09480 [Planctomycetaceae bacterium]|jgi:TIGR03009 family protein|nr:hypothetical protein [Planctomycetaceae bacterium]
MKFTFTLFIGFILFIFVTINYAQQPTAYPQPYRPTGELQPRQPASTSIQNQPIQNQPRQNTPVLPPSNPQPISGTTLQTSPMQNPPKNIVTNGVLTYQNQPTTPTQPNRGFNSPFPTNVAQPTQPAISTQPENRVYPSNPNPNPNPTNPNSFNPNPVNPNPSNPNQPQRQLTATNDVGISYVGGNQVNNSGNSGVVKVADAGRHVGHSAPAVRVHPFILKPEEQKELDEFLLRWERYSETVNNYEVDFNAFYYDPTNPLSPPITSSDPQLKPLKIMFGYFKFVAPRKFIYHVEGEWQQKERIKYLNSETTPNVTAEKTIIDGQSLFFYDFPAKKVTQYKMPPEVMNRTIANGPFPLIFGAKADDMKKRFSMKIVTNPNFRDKEIWLWAVPLLPEDQQEFVKIEIRLDKLTMNAMALKRIDPNEKSYTTYTLQNPRINRLNVSILGNIFNPDVPRGWKLDIQDQLQTNTNPNANPNVRPVAGTVHVPNQPSPNNTQPSRKEIPLYQP